MATSPLMRLRDGEWPSSKEFAAPGDRFIPTRSLMNLDFAQSSLMEWRRSRVTTAADHPVILGPKCPERVLDAPELLDDFYLNLLDWGKKNILAVSLGSSVYLWNPENKVVQKLLSTNEDYNIYQRWRRLLPMKPFVSGKCLNRMYRRTPGLKRFNYCP